MADKPKAHKWREGEGAFIRAHFALEPMPTIGDDGAPSRVKILPWGEFEVRDAVFREALMGEPGTFVVNERSETEIPTHFEELDTGAFVNVDHNSYGPAYGWLEGVEVVEGDGVYMSVNWTDIGEAAVLNRRYRYSSAEIVFDATAWRLGEGPAVVVAVSGAALTNRPAVNDQSTVAFETLTAALSASDGREIETRQNTLGETEEKGDRMASDFWKTFLSRAVGKELNDEVDAATETAKLSEIRENHAKLTADLKASTSMATELTEKLDTAHKAISEFEAADKERRETGQAAQIEDAVTAGKIAPTQSDWAKANFEAFLTLVEGVKDGAVGPPKGRQVSDGVIAGADSTNLTGDQQTVLDLEVKAHLKAHPELNGDYGLAWLAVSKARVAAAAGKEV